MTRATLNAIALLILVVTRLAAFDGHITPSRFSENEIVILAETVTLKESVFGQLMKESDYDDSRPLWIPPGNSIELDRKIVEEFFFVEQVVPRHQAKLYKEGPSPSNAEKRVAETKDAKEKAEVLERMKAHLNKEGLKRSENDYVAYYYSGRAKMKVMESLKGGLESGDEIEVTWDRIRMRIPCPPLRPVKGKSGWILNKCESGDGSYVLVHGFIDWDNAIKIAMGQKKIGEPGSAGQPAAALESNPEGKSKAQPEPEGRSR